MNSSSTLAGISLTCSVSVTFRLVGWIFCSPRARIGFVRWRGGGGGSSSEHQRIQRFPDNNWFFEELWPPFSATQNIANEVFRLSASWFLRETLNWNAELVTSVKPCGQFSPSPANNRHGSAGRSTRLFIILTLWQFWQIETLEHWTACVNRLPGAPRANRISAPALLTANVLLNNARPPSALPRFSEAFSTSRSHLLARLPCRFTSPSLFVLLRTLRSFDVNIIFACGKIRKSSYLNQPHIKQVSSSSTYYFHSSLWKSVAPLNKVFCFSSV